MQAKPRKILVIGGTIFVGRHIVQALLDRGHKVTLFNRGKENPDLFSEAEKLNGDRTKTMDALYGKAWDVVIDTSGYVPRVVQKSVEALKSACELYVYISTGAAYKDKTKFGITEDDEIAIPRNFDAEEITDETYGELKAGCERVVQSVFASRSLIIRPGICVGPHDPTDRFTYWTVRVAAGGRMIAPGDPHRRIQFIDARDLADFTVSMIERKSNGVYNANGPDYSLSVSQFLSECKFVSASDAEFVWVPDDRLLKSLDRWAELPLWIPENSAESGLSYRDNGRAIAAGLKFRPLRETIADTLKWWQKERLGSNLKCGLSREREAQLLAAMACADNNHE
jgi:2'-hydroxyisoflavone reductase